MEIKEIEKLAFEAVDFVRLENESKYIALISAIKDLYDGDFSFFQKSIDYCENNSIRFYHGILGLYYLDERNETKNKKLALEQFNNGLLENDIVSIVCLAYCYRIGIGVKKDELKVMRILQLLEVKPIVIVDNDSYVFNENYFGIDDKKIEKMLFSFFNVFLIAGFGILIERYYVCPLFIDHKKVLRLTSYGASYNVAYCRALNAYLKINSFKENIDYNISVLKEEIENKNLEAYCLYSSLLLNGKFVRKDEKKAIMLSTIAANADYPKALWFLSEVYLDIENEDYKKSFYYCLKAANLGYVSAMHNVALHYYQGVLVKQDIKKAIYYFKKSSENLFYPSDLALAYIYSQNNNIVGPKNEHETENFYLELAKKHGYNAKRSIYDRFGTAL